MIQTVVLDDLLAILYGASSHSDRSRIAPALDRLLACLNHWRSCSPGCVVALFEQLEPSRLVRAVGQTLLAATRFDPEWSIARREFLARFLKDLHVRGTSEPVITRLQNRLEAPT